MFILPYKHVSWETPVIELTATTWGNGIGILLDRQALVLTFRL